MRPLALAALLAATAPCVLAQDAPPRSSLPAGYWTATEYGPVLAKTQELTLAPDLSALTAGERKALGHLLEVGGIVQRLYEDSRHRDARRALVELERLHRAKVSPRDTGELLRLYRQNQGPVAVTLENARVPFLPVEKAPPGRNVYPWGVSKEEIESYLAAHPGERPSLMHPRTVVRRASPASLAEDLAALRRHPVLDALHPGLRTGLTARKAGRGFYAVPYSVAYADDAVKIHALLREAADAVEGDDVEFARYLRNRGRDFLTNDYESGDASWVTGRFKRLNAQLGAYETYDDELFGVKAFYAVSILLRDDAATLALRQAAKGLQALEDALPYEPHKPVREDIPVGVYQVIADFGQARGINTATILPNEAHLAQRYGRTILLRGNIMKHPDLFETNSRTWEAAVTAPFEKDLRGDGDFHRTLWHEIGHYLGVDTDVQGRDLDSALQENASALEEMKADLVSLFSIPALRERGYYDDETMRAVHAAGIRRTLQSVKPRRDQAYQTMQLMQFNYFLENGLLSFDETEKQLVIHYDRYHEVVGKLLREVLAVQRAGDKMASDRFIERWTAWRPELHEPLAAGIRGAQKYRFRLMRFAALGE